jgi:hypothetical protein
VFPRLVDQAGVVSNCAMEALIQSKAGNPYNISAAIAAYGFTLRGYDVIPFAIDEIDTFSFKKEAVVVGGVGTYRRVFQKLGINWEGNSYPPSLTGFLGREIKKIQLNDLAEYVETRPRFIKPAHDNKDFTGFVCKDRWDPRLGGMDGEMFLNIADIVCFKSEYRVYVLEGKIQNVSRYYGLADLFPNGRMIREMISAYEDAPISYGLDVGVDDKGQTLLVETNEGLALGNYGLAPALHAKMIAARWHEVMGDKIRAEEEAQTVDSSGFLNQV